MARFGFALFILWAMILVALAGVFAYTTNCTSDKCTGWWWASIFYFAYTSVAGVIFVPIGLISAIALVRAHLQKKPAPLDS